MDENSVTSFAESCNIYYPRKLCLSSSFCLQSAFCRSGWAGYWSERKCFKYFENSQSWDEAETHCISYSGHLAAVTSLQELSFVQKLCSQDNTGCWVGGRVFNTSLGAWKWSDNASYWNETVAPRISLNSSYNLVDSCALVTNGTVYLMAQSCNTTHAFICMLEAGL